MFTSTPSLTINIIYFMSVSPFIPKAISTRNRHRLLAGLLLCTLVGATSHTLTRSLITNASQQQTWGTFTDGTHTNTATSDEGLSLAQEGLTFSDTTAEDFSAGDTTNISVVTEDDDTELNLLPDLASALVIPYRAESSFLDTTTGLLYIPTGGGLSVINTQGTVDPADDTLVITYTTATTPALPSNNIQHSFLDTTTGLLYVSTSGGGLSVINTQGTVDPADDTLVITYTTATTPALLGNYIQHSFLDTTTGLLYVSNVNLYTMSGLSVINTQRTVDPGDDTLVITYTTATNPAIGYDRVHSSFLDTTTGLLYVSTDAGGLSVINTQGTVDPSDDVLVITYTTATTPAIGYDWVISSFIDTTTGLLYVSTAYTGLSVINTQGTVDPSDDVLVITYTTATTPAIGNNTVWHFFLDTTTDLLYVSTSGGGLSVINTQGTIDPSDDTLVITYTTANTPGLNSNIVFHSFLDTTTGLLYVSTQTGVSVISTGDTTYQSSGEFISSARHLTGTQGTFTYTETKTADHTISLQYRTAASATPYFNDFNDGTTTEYLGDFYSWGDTFTIAEESAGTIKLSEPTSEYIDFLFDTGNPDDYFPLGSTVTARYKINTSATNINVCMFSDDWWDDDGCLGVTPGEWVTTSLSASSKTFSKIGFEILWDTGTWSPSDTFEIDWIRVEPADGPSEWNAWSTPCTDTTCAIDPATLTGNTWIQYKLNLETTNSATTPQIHSVSYTSGYQTTGTYTSEDITFDGTQPLTFSTVESTPASTTLTYAYSTDHGVTWTDIESSHAFPSSFTPSTFMWRAILTTTDVTKTPTLTSVTLTTGRISTSQTGSLTVQGKVKQLESQGKNLEAILLKRKYPHLFAETKDPVRRMEQTIGLMREVVIRLEMLAEMREGEKIGIGAVD